MLSPTSGAREVVSSPCLYQFRFLIQNPLGHFEQRISFGYDADLVHVRAEFDGVMLKIIIPRRTSPVIWNSPAPFGRV
jgi:hypothetical protein